MMPRQSRIGEVVAGKYRLDALLARGGMGLVYSAKHEATGRRVAVKLVRRELVTRPELLQRISCEARIAVAASHPNVVEVLDTGADAQGTPYLVLELLQGRTLEALLVQPLSLFAAAQALLPVMNALCALHASHIVHRDIKPSNLFLNRSASGRVTPKLLDFGVAKALRQSGLTLTQSGTALGTPAYMSPEQALGATQVGPETDVWAMGVVWFRCLTLSLPFEHKGGDAALRPALEALDLSGIDAPLSRVLVRALRFEPSERFGSMTQFRDELLAALREIEPLRTWPGEGTVSYATEETDFGELLGSEPNAEAADTVRHEASDERVTRTLSGVGVASRPRSRALSTAVLAVSAIAFVTYLATSAGGTREERPPAPGRAPLPNVEAPPASLPNLAPQSAAAIDTRAGRPSRAVAIDTAPRRSKSRAEVPVPPIMHEDAAKAASASPPEAAQPLRRGANRAPIIE